MGLTVPATPAARSPEIDRLTLKHRLAHLKRAISGILLIICKQPTVLLDFPDGYPIVFVALSVRLLHNSVNARMDVRVFKLSWLMIAKKSDL